MQGGLQWSNIDFIPPRRNLSDLLTSKRLLADPDHHAQLLNDIAIPEPPARKCPVCSRSFQNNRNLKIHFTRAHKTTRPDCSNQPGFCPCQADLAAEVHVMQTLRKVCAYHQERKYRWNRWNQYAKILPSQDITCRTANEIYVITCLKCKKTVWLGNL